MKAFPPPPVREPAEDRHEQGREIEKPAKIAPISSPVAPRVSA